jgi:hypothetical protein
VDSTSPGGSALRKEVDHGLSINLKSILPGSMPELLMWTDCKFVGNMSTLVQIQLGPTIRQYTTKWYNPPVLHKYPIPRKKKESNFLLDPLFPWDCSSIGQSTALSRRKLRVRAPSVPTHSISTSKSSLLFLSTGGRKHNFIPKGVLFCFPFHFAFLIKENKWGNFHYFN